MKYKVGDKFVWKEGRCCIDFYKNDEYELRYDEKNNTYSLATVYSDCGDYDEFQVNKTYEEICDIIDRDLDSINEECDVDMKDLFKELEGKDIRIKTWEEMCGAENSELAYDRYDNTGREDIMFRNEDGIAETYFSCEMEHLCGKVIHVDKNMVSDGWFRMAEDRLVKDRELVYGDKIFDDYWYLDTNMFDVLEEDTDVDTLEENEDDFYVIEEATHRRVFEGTREQCFKYYKTHVDIFKNQFKRIAVLKEL